MPQSQSLSTQLNSADNAVDTHADHHRRRHSPLGGVDDDGGGQAYQCRHERAQTVVELNVATRIGQLLDRVHRLKAGSKVQTASSFFSEAAFKRAQAIARNDAKTVDTGVARNASRGEIAANAGDFRPIEACSVLVTGASARLSTRGGR